MTCLRSLFLLFTCSLLAGCFVQPGQFQSSLTVLRDGHFTFVYQGEMQIVTASTMAQASGGDSAAGFTPACFDDGGKPRDCSTEEEAAQSKANRLENEQKMRMTSAMGFGLDPQDQASVDRFIAGLTKQKGWRSVVHKGNGIFDVDYHAEGDASHDFVFPIIEGLPAVTPFVAMTVRKDNKLMIEGTGFTGKSGQGEMGMTSLIATRAKGPSGSDNAAQPIVKLDGHFTVRTDGDILTNNTQDGPQMDNGWNILEWRVVPETSVPPQTLIRR